MQVCLLLQIPKSERNIDDLCGEMSDRLGRRQILAILKNFTPSDGFSEDYIDEVFLKRVDDKLMQRGVNGREVSGCGVEPIRARLMSACN